MEGWETVTAHITADSIGSRIYGHTNWTQFPATRVCNGIHDELPVYRWDKGILSKLTDDSFVVDSGNFF